MLRGIHTDLLVTLSCSLSQCPQGQICGSQRGGSTGIFASGTCTIHSDTDCSTFDGVLFRFMAPCSYVLVKSCLPSEAPPAFIVEVVNEQNGNSSLSTVQQVVVVVGHHRISLMKKITRWVVVNGVWQKLPLNIHNVHIESNPVAVSLRTDFGLSVSYDSAGAVHVKLPIKYSDKVCGLCGNFNQLEEDDFRTPNGSNAGDATALAKSWQTRETSSSCETMLVPHQCDPLEEAEYASELYCGGLLSSTGPFSNCLSVVGAESYFRGCVVGMCSTHGDPGVLCETLKVYADICQEAGVAVPLWRNSSSCSLQCGENSHYNSCADVGSCGSCVERCDCDPGYKLDGGKCVPAEGCGCWYEGKHYEKGETLMEGECVQQCKCMGNNELECKAMRCADSEVCKVKDGVKGCFAFHPVTCSVYGDPHYITFDGLAYDFQGGCSYTLMTTCGRESTVQFTVIGHNMHPALQNFTRSKLQAVSLQVDDLYLNLNTSGEVKNNSVGIPYFTNGTYGSVWVNRWNNYIILESTFGLRIMIDGENRLFLQVDDRYKYELCGLCGTYSEHQDDDFITPGGQNATGPFEFGDSWRLPGSDECVAQPNDPRVCDYEEENEAYNECFTLVGEPFKPCHERIHPSIYLNSCVYDYCDTSGDQNTLCESLKSYAAACEVAGVELLNWQMDTACADPPTTATPPTIPTASSPTPDQILCPMNCDFEKNMCGWEQLIQDSFDWTRNSGSTPSDQTGPNQDHTTGAGSYMYIEGNSATHGDSARLISSTCHFNGPLCLHFWYHMYGSSSAMALNIFLLKGNKATKLWSRMNNQGPEWHPVNVDIEVSGPFQILVEAIRGSNDQSDVAIDDISIHFGSCKDLNDVVTNPPVPEGNTTAPLHCNFEQDVCQWKQLLTDVFDWTRHSGATPTMMTGPSSDHTTGDGHYLYIEANGVSHGDTARLISSECVNSGPQCLQFWYHMYGSADTMGLHVYLLQDRLANAVWWKRNDQGNTWHLAEVDLTTTGAFQVNHFEGRRGSNDQSDVAIDDVSLHYGHCAGNSTLLLITFETQPPTTQSPTTAQPEAPTTVRPQPPTTGGPQPTTTAQPQPQTTAQPQPPTSVKPEPPTTAKPHPPTTVRPQPPTTAQPKPPTTAQPQPPTSDSHYTTCVPSCSPTCSSLNGPPHCSENEGCVQGCVCDDGFVQKGRVCVPIQLCGCVDRNGNKRQFSEEWYTSHCSEKCKCKKDSGVGRIECDDKDECDGNAVCLPNENDDYYCQSTGFSECSIKGDPEYRTFDRFKHDFEGRHSYVLIQTKNLPNNLQEVYIEGINRRTEDEDDSHHHDDSSSEEDNSHRIRDEDEDEDDDDDDDDKDEDDSHNDESEEDDEQNGLRELKIRVYNHTVEFKKKRKLTMDGKRTNTPVSLPGLSIWQHSSRIYLKTDFGLSVEFDGQSEAEIILPNTYKRKVGGLCGNFDGRKQNDLMMPDGTRARNVQEFGESWRV
uniref:Zonadhesin-like n=1 Tax=Labrus bergylta TaxID=56723 RepID=A0A3Q3GAV2_9LABR